MLLLYYSNLLLFFIVRLYLYIFYVLFLKVLLSYMYLMLFRACTMYIAHMTVNSTILRFSKIEIYYKPIKSFWNITPRHITDKLHSGMPCMHVLSRYLPHLRLELFYSLYNLISLYNNNNNNNNNTYLLEVLNCTFFFL